MAAPIVLICCLVTPAYGMVRVALDILFCLALAPAIIVSGILIEVPARLITVSKWLGYASYPVYVMHRGVLGLYKPVVEHFGIPTWLSVALFLPGIVLMAIVISRVVDWFTRRRLSRR